MAFFSTMRNITIPDVKAGGPDTGLSLHRGEYRAEYREGGRRKFHRLGTVHQPTARALRNSFYRSQLANGATIATKGRKPRDTGARRAAAMADPDIYILERKPFVVVIDSKIVGDAGSREEARKLRNKHLGIKP